jgi:ComF family protein
MNLADYFMALLFPRICKACGKVLFKNEEIICTKCLYNLPQTHFHRYPDNAVMQIFWGRLNLYSATAFLRFTKTGMVQKLIHQLKYKGNYEIGIFLGELCGSKLKDSEYFNTVDVVIPVPLHWKKEKKRGYNQSEMFARGLSKTMGAELNTKTLLRKIHTETQTKKSREERWQNVSDVFALSTPEQLAGRHILLVDDVITTGATLEASAAQLFTIPDVKVSIATIATAGKY